ncbi:uncharacterized protein G2W53_008964 [Senna tora]|uniref:Uncharacterized protein n=1 Tax=Senna tora TaxID=362788 RepID=A0A835C9B4_9FABA|nr:uncharacterized protein G2W53_008964 [Senna tora]
MAATPAKQRRRVDSDNVMCDFQHWDCYHDFSTHVRKIKRLQSRTEKHHFFTSLSSAFVLPTTSLAEPEVVNFISHLYGTVKRELLVLQEENREVDVYVDVDDPQYKFFLENLRADGKSYVLNIPRDGVFVKYEAENCALPPPSDDCTNRVSFDSKGTKGSHACADDNAGVRLNEGFEAEKQDTEPKGKRKRGRPKKSDVENAGAGLNECLSVKEEEEDDPPNVNKVVHVQEPVMNVDHLWHKRKVNARKHTEFREKLMEALKKPYCEKEYMELLQQSEQRKPVQNNRNLRGRIIVYEENRAGKSLLDHHADVARRLDSARDDHRRALNILRGFFYWLKWDNEAYDHTDNGSDHEVPSHDEQASHYLFKDLDST